jgi:RNA polymerase sporulation-specific sigma factor
MQSSLGAVKSSFHLPELDQISEVDFQQILTSCQSGSEAAKDALIESNLRLVMSIAQRFAGRGEIDDLFQIGCLGLLKAVDRFDSAYGVKFSTYAVPLIIGEIKQHLRDSGLMKVSRSLKETAYRIGQSRMELMAELGREPTLSELAVASGLSREEITTALEAVQPVSSLHEFLNNDEGAEVCREELLGDENAHNQWWERYILYEGLAGLPKRLQLLIELRFFQEKTQAEVARLFGVSQVQVCRLEKLAINQLRGFYQSEV